MLDDTAPGQVYVYAGDKSASADRVAAAGLSDGNLLAIQVSGLAQETDATTLTSAPFTVINLGNVSALSGNALETASAAATKFNRPEDKLWDPSNPNDFYFVTTASFTGKSRLWLLRFLIPRIRRLAELPPSYWTAPLVRE